MYSSTSFFWASGVSEDFTIFEAASTAMSAT